MNRIAKVLLLLIVLGTWVSCCNLPVPTSPKDKKEEFDKYSQMFISSLRPRLNGAYLENIKVSFYKIGSNSVGLCRSGGIGAREVVFDPDYWDNSSKTKRLSTVFHELAHCVCNLGHTWDGGVYPEASSNGIPHTGLAKDGFFEDLCPVSVVFPYVVDDECARKHWGEYIKDLYKRCEP